MIGAQSRPPNHTGDHGHHETKQNETRPRLSTRAATPRVDKHPRSAANMPRFSQNNNPLFHTHGLPSSKPATQTGGHNSQTDDYLNTSKNPANTTSLPCARPTRVRVFLR
ncbi:hypothetical protein E2C01_076313 [Portunus trituberculatus]|uniref:Uncharacterized protein n=1 Tax=Portunus trituberculatus TaxID=210409 RepID=A0A5B7IHD6_PORTR|nr:hypothetical protein [Portunus trituberculatus]